MLIYFQRQAEISRHRRPVYTVQVQDRVIQSALGCLALMEALKTPQGFSGWSLEEQNAVGKWLQLFVDDYGEGR
jgi:hypothetical protein